MPTGARLARTDDVDDIATITVGVWSERLSSRAWPTPALVADTDAAAAVWADAILHPPTALHRLAVAVDDTDRVRGYAAWMPSPDPDCDPGDVELSAFEVAPDARGQGHGSRLMSAVVDLCASQGALALSHWCQVEDEQRRSFFISAGWAPDSAWRDIQIDDTTTAREVRLVTSVSDTAAG